MSDDEDYQQAALKALEAHQKAFESQFAPPSSATASQSAEEVEVSEDSDDDDEGSIRSFDSDDDIIGSNTGAEVDDLFNVGRCKFVSRLERASNLYTFQSKVKASRRKIPHHTTHQISHRSSYLESRLVRLHLQLETETAKERRKHSW